MTDFYKDLFVSLIEGYRAKGEIRKDFDYGVVPTPKEGVEYIGRVTHSHSGDTLYHIKVEIPFEDSDLSVPEKLHTLFHELGHVYYNHFNCNKTLPEEEFEADMFAHRSLREYAEVNDDIDIKTCDDMYDFAMESMAGRILKWLKEGEVLIDEIPKEMLVKTFGKNKGVIPFSMTGKISGFRYSYLLRKVYNKTDEKVSWYTNFMADMYLKKCEIGAMIKTSFDVLMNNWRIKPRYDKDSGLIAYDNNKSKIPK